MHAYILGVIYTFCVVLLGPTLATAQRTAIDLSVSKERAFL